MLNILIARWKQGHRTIAFPKAAPALPDRFRGRPVIARSQCLEGCQACAEACPTQAIALEAGTASVDLGRCLFCQDCVNACPQGAIQHDTSYALAASSRDALRVRAEETLQVARALDARSRALFGRSLKLRQVSAAGCNACEADLNVLGTVVFDLGRFGIQFVASPRHADGLVITGPVSDNMRLALEKTYAATPSPKIVVAVGACAISGGPFRDHAEVHNGASAVVPVDLYVPGCPPHPITILDGLLRILGRIEDGSRPLEPVPSFGQFQV